MEFDIINWYTENFDRIVEFLGAAAGILYLYLSIRKNIYLWHVGFITSALYIYVFLVSKFYADMGLQVYYLVISVYGWYHWKFAKNGNNDNKKLPVKTAEKKLLSIILFITLALFIIIGYMLNNYTDSPLPYWDAFTTAASITATWMLARKIIEHWIFWIVIDAISAGLYLFKDLYFTTFLFIVYTIMAIVGYIEWKKDIVKQTDNTLEKINVSNTVV